MDGMAETEGVRGQGERRRKPFQETTLGSFSTTSLGRVGVTSSRGREQLV